MRQDKAKHRGPKNEILFTKKKKEFEFKSVFFSHLSTKGIEATSFFWQS